MRSKPRCTGSPSAEMTSLDTWLNEPAGPASGTPAQVTSGIAIGSALPLPLPVGVVGLCSPGSTVTGDEAEGDMLQAVRRTIAIDARMPAVVHEMDRLNAERLPELANSAAGLAGYSTGHYGESESTKRILKP